MSLGDRFGIGFGISGMICCIVGILAQAVMRIAGSDYDPTTFKMLSLKLGAFLLLISALLAGKNARMFQVLEASAIVFGAIYFIGLDTTTNLVIRIAGTAILMVVLWQAGLLRGSVNKIGAVGSPTKCRPG